MRGKLGSETAPLQASDAASKRRPTHVWGSEVCPPCPGWGAGASKGHLWQTNTVLKVLMAADGNVQLSQDSHGTAGFASTPDGSLTPMHANIPPNSLPNESKLSSQLVIG